MNYRIVTNGTKFRIEHYNENIGYDLGLHRDDMDFMDNEEEEKKIFDTFDEAEKYLIFHAGPVTVSKKYKFKERDMSSNFDISEV